MSRELIEQYYAAWQPGNADAILAFFTEDAVFEDLAFEARFEGPDQIRAFIDLTYSGIPDFAVKPTHIVVGDGGAVHDARHLRHVEIRHRLADRAELVLHTHVDDEGARRHQKSAGNQRADP